MQESNNVPAQSYVKIQKGYTVLNDRMPALLQWTDQGKLRLLQVDKQLNQTVVFELSPSEIKKFQASVGLLVLFTKEGNFQLDFVDSAAANNMIAQLGLPGQILSIYQRQTTDLQWWSKALRQAGVKKDSLLKKFLIWLFIPIIIFMILVMIVSIFEK